MKKARITGLARLLVLISLLTVALATQAIAEVIYSYDNGKGMTGSFTVADPLAANLSSININPIAFSFTVGGWIWDQTNTTLNESYFDISTNAQGGITRSWDIKLVLYTGMQYPSKATFETLAHDYVGFEDSPWGIDQYWLTYPPPDNNLYFVSSTAERSSANWTMSTSPGGDGGGGGGGAVPEPSTMLLLAAGLLGAGIMKKKMN